MKRLNSQLKSQEMSGVSCLPLGLSSPRGLALFLREAQPLVEGARPALRRLGLVLRPQKLLPRPLELAPEPPQLLLQLLQPVAGDPLRAPPRVGEAMENMEKYMENVAK